MCCSREGTGSNQSLSREMEEEAEKLKELQNEVQKQMNMSPPPAMLAH